MPGRSTVYDAIHGVIPFNDDRCDQLLLRLINTKEFQRLRRIRQLGMCALVFPGADHSRFAHSIGVMHTARRFLKRLEYVVPHHFDDDRGTVVLAAALLHDLGHGPFSHAFEKITNEDHEARTVEVITDETTEVNQVLRSYSAALPDRLKGFFTHGSDATQNGSGAIPQFLAQVVSSQLDADRFDYLVRDSHMTGMEYGQLDVPWLLEHLYVDDTDSIGKRFYFSSKAFCAVEAYIFARHHMYRTVYFHKTIRAAEVMLRLLFKRYKALLSAAASDEDRNAIVPDASPRVRLAFSANAKMTLGQYLSLDDHTIGEFFKACEAAEDGWIRQFGVGLVHRRLYKAQDVTGADQTHIADFVSAARTMLREKGHDDAYSFVDDKASDTPYKPYDPDAEEPATQIYVQTPSGVKEMSTQSRAVETLNERYTLLRYYFPPLMRTEVNKLWQGTL